MNRIYTPGAMQGTGEGVRRDFNQVEVYDAGHVQREEENMRISKIIGTILVRKFNNREWKVITDVENQMLIVGCDSISNNKGYHIHMKGRSLRTLAKIALKGAGEILERHNLARSKGFNVDVYETLPRDLQDNVITPDSAAEPI